ncbi:MAG: hypothetical protein IPH26_09555 [Sterolibacteriaceae bacterium]|uniref:Uncharacterized protein n=1 Tax=Candidatus Methylophosphatis roskildensis TaxID=2899263 RepID=A0A9D7E2Y6_9PROT|nr:hypothetical protein [Candidatus Methylophosphatis roskildensis]MBK7238256.1 hypothetical protein [Sterolibacteriaceae bacterium]
MTEAGLENPQKRALFRVDGRKRSGQTARMQAEDTIAVRETQPNPRPGNMSVHGVLGRAGIEMGERAPVPAPAESEPVCSISESLAHGLVNRLAAECRASDLAAIQSAGMPALPLKPAAAFRAACRWLDSTIPEELWIGSVQLGDDRGKSKDAQYAVIHWAPRDDTRSLVASCLMLSARKLKIVRSDLLDVTGHALMRLFYPLKTTSAPAVLAELSAGVLSFDQWATFLYRLPEFCDILVPTSAGALAVARNCIPGSTKADFVARTWTSHARIADNPARLDAVQRAFAEQGVVLNARPYPLLTRPRIVVTYEATQAGWIGAI